MEENFDIQERIKIFNAEKPCHKRQMPTFARIIDIISEIGDLAKQYLNVTNYGTTPFKYNDNFELEFGDVFYSLFSLAAELGVDARKVLERSLLKYKIRIERKNSMANDKVLETVETDI